MKTIIKWTSLFALALGLSFNANAQFESEEGASGSWGSDAWGQEEEQSEADRLRDLYVNLCNRDSLRTETKYALKPYRYCMAKTTEVTMKRYPNKVRVTIPVYYNMKHLMLWNTAGLPDGVQIMVFDGPASEKKREMLFKSDPSKDLNSFELSEEYGGMKLFFEYFIPPVEADDNKTYRGCVVFMMGYLDPTQLPEDEGTMATEGAATSPDAGK